METRSVEPAEPWTVKASTMETTASAEPAAVKPRSSTVETAAPAVTTATLGKTGFW